MKSLEELKDKLPEITITKAQDEAYAQIVERHGNPKEVWIEMGWGALMVQVVSGMVIGIEKDGTAHT